MIVTITTLPEFEDVLQNYFESNHLHFSHNVLKKESPPEQLKFKRFAHSIITDSWYCVQMEEKLKTVFLKKMCGTSLVKEGKR